jgi:CubicO group peptidase (beta-lactamase class C family)
LDERLFKPLKVVDSGFWVSPSKISRLAQPLPVDPASGLKTTVRQGDGIAGVPGSAGEFMWAGYAGTFFWVDPQEELVGVYMTQAPSPIRAYYRKMFKTLVYQALVD